MPKASKSKPMIMNLMRKYGDTGNKMFNAKKLNLQLTNQNDD